MVPPLIRSKLACEIRGKPGRAFRERAGEPLNFKEILMAILNPLQIDRIRRNHRGGDLTAGQLLEMLQHKVAPGAERAGRELVRRMAAHGHYNRASHKIGSRDRTMHITIWVNNKGNHLRLDSHNIIFQITNDSGSDLGIVSPWVAPGSET